MQPQITDEIMDTLAIQYMAANTAAVDLIRRALKHCPAEKLKISLVTNRVEYLLLKEELLVKCEK